MFSRYQRGRFKKERTAISLRFHFRKIAMLFYNFFESNASFHFTAIIQSFERPLIRSAIRDLVGR